jgi:hypothetical protein
MSKKKTKTEGYKALWNIIHAKPTRADLLKVVSDIGGHDDRIGAVHHVANVLGWLADTVGMDCDEMSEGHGKDADRYGDNPAALDHYMSQVWYAYEAQRMANYSARIEEAHERDDELEQARDALQEEHDGEMTKEQAEEAIDNI